MFYVCLISLIHQAQMHKYDRVWQLAFGSGFKCNSAVWRAVRRVRRPARSPWLDCIDSYPARMDA